MSEDTYALFGETLVKMNDAPDPPKYVFGINCAASSVDEFLKYGPKGKAWNDAIARTRQARRRVRLGRAIVNAQKRKYYQRPDRAEKRDALLCELELSRPIVAIDSEGQDYLGADL